ncbi:beta-ketoacyl reductase, partial [Streptomyces virginiae]|uniref:acyl carrier protein n=1 Tax=Streptomyces virginiae TaxID=1961 RepID=UPI0035E03275
LAWGFWEQRSGMTAHLSDEDVQRIKRTGVLPLPSELGLELFDIGSGSAWPALAPIRLDTAALRANGVIAPVLRGLVRAPARRTVEAGPAAGGQSLADRLVAMAPAERERFTLDLVRRNVATVLGHDGVDSVAPAQAFKEIGFDSLTAVELRNRLTAATGLRLPATLVFDYPSPAALAHHLCDELVPTDAVAQPADSQESLLRAALADIPLARLRDAGVLDVLLTLTGLGDETAAPDEESDSIDAMDAETLIQLALSNPDS